MFKRIIYDDWTSIVPLISFWFTFVVFLLITGRALLMRKSNVRHISSLPLKDEKSSNPAKPEKS